MTTLSTRLRWGLLGLAGVLLAGGLMLPRAGESGPAPAPVSRGIVLVCIDTLRADGISLPGEPEGPMPRLQAFARGATIFADATASSSWTEPSVASLLTGLRPLHHGVLPFFAASRLVSSIVTLAERLKAAGWSTGAITGGGWVSPDVGLDQGFDRFATSFDEARPEATIGAWDQARRKDVPFFLFLHTYTAHDPYGNRGWRYRGASALHTQSTLTPADLVEGLDRAGGRLTGDLLARFGVQFLTDPRGRFACRDVIGARRFEALGMDLVPWYEGGYAAAGDAPALEASIRDSYRAGLTDVDEAIGEAFTALAQRGLLDGADVIVTGDHGECFGEHRTLWHGLHVYDEALRVPMVVRARGRMGAPQVVHGACDLTDVAPTVLALAGLPPASDLDGRSLLTLAERAEPGRTAIAEMERSRDHNRPTEARVRTFVARSTDWKWILRYDPEDATILGQELFHLASDPGEKSPLPTEESLPPSVGEEFRRVVADERARLRRLANPKSVGAGNLAR